MKWVDRFDKEYSFNFPSLNQEWHFSKGGMKNLKDFIRETIKTEREQAVEERDEYWRGLIMKKLYNENTCNDINEIFNLMDKK